MFFANADRLRKTMRGRFSDYGLQKPKNLLFVEREIDWRAMRVGLRGSEFLRSLFVTEDDTSGGQT